MSSNSADEALQCACTQSFDVSRAVLLIGLIDRASKKIANRGNSGEVSIHAKNSKAMAIVLIGLGGATTCADLAREMCHNRGATSRTIEQLVKENLVSRKQSIKDRRIILLTLTDIGVKSFFQISCDFLSHQNYLVELMGPDELLTFLRVLEALGAKLDTLNGPSAYVGND